jgi:mannose-6-phosphate isomerase
MITVTDLRVHRSLMVSPQRLRPGNFTPPERTPWGGHKILSTYKRDLSIDLSPHEKVGESWEISTEPSFPSTVENGVHLSDVIAGDPVGWLGDSIAKSYGGDNPLLVKLIDPELTLSVQVHPPEDHGTLAPGESGKTEAWIVLDADQDASIYLGFVPGVTQTVVQAHVAAGRSLEPMLNRFRVAPGDVFMIRPGVVHALGAGVTVIEPQRVRPRRRAVTYRMWDWNRRFDQYGQLSPTGMPRPLHIREALAAIDWTGAATGSSSGPSCIHRSSMSPDGSAILLDEPELFVQEYSGTVSIRVTGRQRMLGLLCLSGTARVTWADGWFALRAGETCVIPAAMECVELALSESRVMVTYVQS